MDIKIPILEEHFYKDIRDSIYRSRKKWLGVSTGDDKTLIIEQNILRHTMTIYWKDNRGFETTIFEGIILEEDKELRTLLNWLEIDKFLKWI